LSFIWAKRYRLALAAYPPASTGPVSNAGILGIAPPRV